MLVQRIDFNLFDAFSIFDLNKNGYISLTEFKNGLADLGIYTTYDEIDLFFKRYDKNKDGRLRFTEFSDAFLP